MHVEAAQYEAKQAAIRLRRQRQARIRLLKRLALGAVVALVVGALIFGFVYAGAAEELPAGARVAGVDVGGLSTAEARRLLRRREAALASVPLPVGVGGRSYHIRPGQVGIAFDWRRAVADAHEKGDGFGPVRGFRRVLVRAFGAEVMPYVRVDRKALDAVLAQMARDVDVPHRDALIRLDGLQPVVVPGESGRVIDRKQAGALIVSSFASLTRDRVTLPLRRDRPVVTAKALRPVAAKARIALAAPIRLQLGTGYFALPLPRIAQILDLPANGERTLRIAGPKADAYFRRLEKSVNSAPKDAQFEVSAGRIEVVPAVAGRALDVPQTAENILAAAFSRTKRLAPIVVTSEAPERTTQEARAMGITEVVGSYTTEYGGIANRIHNVQLVSRLIDETLISPGATFSFNGTTGERNEDKGFLEAPVIINGELQTGLGGGVCQVSTTVFNAAYEAGLAITARTNHALYISHYPQGRDATVDYPGVDLKFVNDTEHWLLLRTFVSASSLTVNLYGTNPDRRVESETGELRVTGGPPTAVIRDPSLFKGEQVVDAAGSPYLATSVQRRVYTASGRLLHDDVWSSSYRGEKRIVRVGTKPKPKPKPKPRSVDHGDLGIPPIVGSTPDSAVPQSTAPDAAAPDAVAPPASESPAPDAPTPEPASPAAPEAPAPDAAAPDAAAPPASEFPAPDRAGPDTATPQAAEPDPPVPSA